jgi:hypothetical protein
MTSMIEGGNGNLFPDRTCEHCLARLATDESTRPKVEAPVRPVLECLAFRKCHLAHSYCCYSAKI